MPNRSVERGRAANVECLECGERLLVRKGQKNIWHFAHEDHSNCSASGESILHFVAKHRLAVSIDRFLPAPDTGNLGRIRIKYGKTEAGIEGEKEGEIVRRSDVVLGVEIPRSESDDLVYIIVEVNVTNRKDDEYIELLKKHNIPALEVDVPLDTGESLNKLDQLLVWIRSKLALAQPDGGLSSLTAHPPAGTPRAAQAFAHAQSAATTLII